MKRKSDDDKAALEGEVGELRRQLDESRAQQAATADILRAIAAAPGAGGTLRKIAATTARLFGAAGTAFLIAEGDEFALTIGTGHGAEQVDAALYGPGKSRPRVGEQTLPSAVVRENRQIHLPDLDRLPAEVADFPGLPILRAAGIRSAVGTPLRREGQAIGALLVHRDKLRPFAAEELQLLQSFADQASIAVENARLLTETREALEQQTATAEVLQVINASPGGLAPVFDAMLDKALQLCDANYGYLLTFDGEGFVPVADRGNPAFSVWVRERGKIVPEPGTINARIIAGDAVVHVADVVNDPFYQSDTAMRRAVLEIGGFRTVLTVALRKDDALLGVIHIYRQEVRSFSDRQIALLQNFAAQAVIAMENARLLTETRERLEQQTATAEVLRVINSSPGDPTPVFDAMLEKAVRLCEAAYGVMFVVEGDRMRGVAERNVPNALSEYLAGSPPRIGRDSMLGRALLDRKILHTADPTGETSGREGPLAAKTAELGDARALVMAPLTTEEAVLGVFALFRTEARPFTDKQIALLQNFAAQAVIAMENARLLGELRQRTEEVAALNRGLEARVAEAVDELGRVGRLKRFLAPQLAELIVSQGDEKILESHRREIVVVFCDLRGYTAFTETAEPEEVLDFLREYHGALGPLVSQFEGTLDQFSGDGIMVFFNDPVPIPDPAERAVKMAMAMRESAGALTAVWRRRGRELGFGVGISQGYATLGQIGFSERSGYTAIGTVCNVAARLCAEAKDGQILIAQRVAVGLGGDIVLEDVGPLPLKGITQPVVAFNVAAVGSTAGRLRLV